MQKILQFSILLLTVSLFVACSNTKKATTTRQDFKGSWYVSAVTVEGENKSKLNIVSFDDAALNCFEGSQWYFPNSGYGNYSITKSGCAAGERQIIWSQRVKNGMTYLNFKRMDGVKRSDSKRVEDGYSLEVTNYEKNHFTASSPVLFEGKTIYIVYHFERR